MQTHLSADALSSMIRVALFFLVELVGRYLSQREIYALFLSREREGRELFLHLLILNCLQLKAIFGSKWHNLGCYVLIPINIYLQNPLHIASY